MTGSNDQVDLDLNFGSAGDDRNAGLFDNVTPAQLMFGVAATEITDAENKVSSVAITITAPQGGSVNAGEALGISPDTLALVSSLLGFTVEVSGNGGQSLTISAPSGQFFTAQALETLLENVTYAINQSDFSFNASDRALSVTVTDFSTGATSDTALLTLDMRADVTATAGQNAFTGGNLSDLARGGAGDDVIAGGAGDDALVGGADNDTLTGGSGNDTIIGNDATVVRSGATFNVGGITGAAPNAGESDTAVYSAPAPTMSSRAIPPAPTRSPTRSRDATAPTRCGASRPSTSPAGRACSSPPPSRCSMPRGASCSRPTAPISSIRRLHSRTARAAPTSSSSMRPPDRSPPGPGRSSSVTPSPSRR